MDVAADPRAPIPFAEFCTKVEEHLQRCYGIPVVTRDIPDPLLGDLDGTEIHIDHAVSAEERLFLLAHLFGHTVQWNVNPRALEVGRPHQPPVSEDLLPAIMEYEEEAARYALGMLHEIGITGIEQWLSDYTAADMAYLHHFYRTGEKRAFATFQRHNAPLLEPKAVPVFTTTKRTFRLDGIVI